LKDIGEQFGGKDHTTVLHACDKIHREIDRNPTIRQTVDQLTKALRS
jgi:chromosomal replication initiator protein